MATLKEIADKAGVSIRTVGRVLNGDINIRPDKIDRVKKVLKNTGYTPNIFARGLRNKRTGIIGIIAVGFELEVSAKKLSALQRELMNNGHGAMLGITFGDADIENRLVQEYASFYDGIIFLSNPQKESLQIIKRLKTPYVISDSYLKLVRAVSIDRESGVCDAILSQRKNYKKLFFITNIVTKNDARKMAFNEGSRVAGISDCRIIQCKTADFNGGLLAAKDVIKEKGGLAICYNDRMAAGLLKGLYSKGCNIPDDFGIVGFDDDSFTTYTHKSISTVTQSVDELAKKTLILLERQIKGCRIRKVSSVQTRFIARETTACLPYFAKQCG